MVRKRQARRCAALRTDGSPCRGWAIVGGAVCWSHGGASRQARDAAYFRECERHFHAEFGRVYERWRRELAVWQAERVATTARLLGMDPAEVTGMDIVLAHIEFGIPPLEDEAPRMRPDRRFKPPKPPPRRPAPTGP